LKGLILKDLYSLMHIYKKNLTLLFVLYATIAIFSRSGLIITVFAWMMGVYSLSSITLDEKSGWNRYVRTLPVEVEQIIAGKFIITLLFIATGFAFAILIELINSVLHGFVIDLSTITFFAPLSILSMGIMIPCAIKWGLEKARYTFVLLMALIYTVPMLFKNIRPELAENIAKIVGSVDVIREYSTSLFIIAAGVYIVGFIISCRIYDKKEF